MPSFNNDPEGWCEDEVKEGRFADVAQCLEQTTATSEGGKRKRTRRHHKRHTHRKHTHHKRTHRKRTHRKRTHRRRRN